LRQTGALMVVPWATLEDERTSIPGLETGRFRQAEEILLFGQ